MKTPSFLENIAAGEMILTPTAMSARALRRAFDDRQRQRGLSAWQPADIFSWQQFLHHLWSQAVTSGIEHRLLLNAAQEHSLWTSVIQARPFTASPASIERLAGLSAKAWTLACAYDCVKKLSSTANTPDTRAFAAWSADFIRLCQKETCVAEAGLERALAQHIAQDHLASANSFKLVGFADFTPAQTHLLEALRKAGTRTNIHDLRVDTQQTKLFAAPDATGELDAIAQHIRARLEAQPDVRIAVVLPDAADVPHLEIIFREMLAPELEFIGADPSSAPWEFADKGPLFTQPVVTAAVHLLQTLLAPQPLQTISDLVLSPYLGTEQDRTIAPLFDAQGLRRRSMLRPELDLAGLQRIAQVTKQAPGWITRVSAWLAASTPNGNRGYADWAAYAQAALRAAQWPGPRSLTSLEYQATEAFDSLLDTLATLDFRARRISLADFLTALARLASTTPFTPASTFAPVQVMSPSAAVAQSFDVLIVARATAENYPAREQAHPLFSFALQASLQMPGTDAASLHRRAHQMWSQLVASSEETLLTYALQSENGPQHLSPLLESLAKPAPADIYLAPHDAPLDAELFIDETPQPPLPSTHVSGGARLLKLQAACGFLAFAELRLNAAQLDSPVAGLDPLRSGNLIHNSLENFWSEVRTQQALRGFSSEDLRSTLERAIAKASAAPAFTANTSWEKAFMAMQKERVLHVLLSWMKQELQRAPFTVASREEDKHITVGPLTLRVRLDRMDEVEGGQVLVDYKTGSNIGTRLWEGDRPDEPQLPLYALLGAPDKLKGVAFAHVIAGADNRWVGYQSETGIFSPKGPRELTADIEQWRATLTALAENFAAGVVDVNPKSFDVNCARCGQRLLCRVNPESFLQQSEAEDASSGEDAE